MELNQEESYASLATMMNFHMENPRTSNVATSLFKHVESFAMTPTKSPLDDSIPHLDVQSLDSKDPKRFQDRCVTKTNCIQPTETSGHCDHRTPPPEGFRHPIQTIRSVMEVDKKVCLQLSNESMVCRRTSNRPPTNLQQMDPLTQNCHF